MALRSIVTAAALVACAAISVTPANATPVGPAYVRTTCGTMTGPKWKTLVGSWSGNKYIVTVSGPQVAPSCGEAKAWVATLIKDRAPNHSTKLVDPNILTNGPDGYTCKAGADAEGRAYEGSCYKGSVFDPAGEADWAPVLPV